ncbi:hypothetical protein A1OQ_05675 [Enterovibrio norvegicus FF-162]|uniref:ABC-three component system middle component 6 n=1 Tax=Enterovibrio norvegicus TaxID=188144 RepID=UPI000362DAE7|nr:ABC-three component system middle component 6 [Enterovibrio norvegicus]OEE77130.1 hypothetical protein A1OQ_05675 [Enterovibrio norvegicus FF-162]
MITIDSDPKLNPIYIGASILNVLNESDFIEIEIEDLHSSIKRAFDTSYEVFAFALDWLYIIGAIDLNEDGLITYAVK